MVKQAEPNKPKALKSKLLTFVGEVRDKLAGPRTFLGKVWDALIAPLGEPIADIRKKVVEEGYFGREVTPREVHLDQPPISSAQVSLGFKELMAAQAAAAPKEPGKAPDQGVEI